jgi:hypothetical protein
LYCDSSDIVYEISVTPKKSGQSTSFITLSERTATWVTSSNLNIGNYTVTVTGNIKTNTPASHSASVSFNLLVSNCTTSYETIIVTKSATPAD